jgi:hypothetical protein
MASRAGADGIHLANRWPYRAAMVLACATALLLIAANGAVGVVGSEDDSANLMYAAVIAVVLAGAAVARLRAHGMARAMLAAAVAQVTVALIAIAAGWGEYADPEWPRDIVMVTGFFTALWLASAWLFGRASSA